MSKRFPKIHTIGVVGKMGSGKSTALEWFKSKGIPTLDADALVHELYEPKGLGQQKIQSFFGEEYLDKRGAVNRKKLLRTLGKSPKKWEVLNRIVLPLVADQIQRKLHKTEGGVMVIEIQNPELRYFEPYLNEYWILSASDEKREKRLRDRNYAPKDLENLERQQKKWEFPQGTVIKNEGTPHELEQQLENLWKERKNSL